MAGLLQFALHFAPQVSLGIEVGRNVKEKKTPIYYLKFTTCANFQEL